MRVRNLLLLLLVVVIIAAFAYTVFIGFPVGVGKFAPVESTKLGLDLTGGVYIIYQAVDPSQQDFDVKMTGAIAIFRQRLDAKSFTEATISRQGDSRIRVEIPINQTSTIKDPNEIVKFIGEPAKLQFLGPDGVVIMEGKDIVSAKPGTSQEGQYVVYFELTDYGKGVFGAATQKFLGQAISIQVDGGTISSPTVNSVIPNGSGYIEGSFTAESAANLAMQIESGALPLELSAIEQRTISSTLGDEALQKSIYAGIIGFILLLIFMIIVFRLPGLAADIALLAYISMVCFFLSWFEIQLTLPGIAGIILGVGMAVDANVIIFARFKEEVYGGKSIRSAMKSGFNKAARAITDSNVTTIIAALVLGVFGTGPIKGFAYTLGLSIIISMFSALVLTQSLLRLFVGIFPNGSAIFLPKKREKKVATEVQA